VSDSLGILGFYFTLIGFISGIFFTRLDSWYNDVRAKVAVVNASNDARKLVSLRDDLAGLSSSTPGFSFTAIGLFLTALAILSTFVPAGTTTVNVTIFLYIPLFVTVLVYWISGFVILTRARTLLKAARDTIARKT
jgi:sterol desaturase/sphingolipid hydroxylase (fatty acid hydroxylase superfamily)